MDQVPSTLNIRDAYQLEKLIAQADGMILKQMLVLLRLRLNGEDVAAAENEMNDLRKDVASLRAQRAHIETSLGIGLRAAE